MHEGKAQRSSEKPPTPSQYIYVLEINLAKVRFFKNHEAGEKKPHKNDIWVIELQCHVEALIRTTTLWEQRWGECAVWKSPVGATQPYPLSLEEKSLNKPGKEIYGAGALWLNAKSFQLEDQQESK